MVYTADDPCRVCTSGHEVRERRGCLCNVILRLCIISHPGPPGNMQKSFCQICTSRKDAKDGPHYIKRRQIKKKSFGHAKSLPRSIMGLGHWNLDRLDYLGESRSSFDVQGKSGTFPRPYLVLRRHRCCAVQAHLSIACLC